MKLKLQWQPKQTSLHQWCFVFQTVTYPVTRTLLTWYSLDKNLFLSWEGNEALYGKTLVKRKGMTLNSKWLTEVFPDFKCWLGTVHSTAPITKWKSYYLLILREKKQNKTKTPQKTKNQNSFCKIPALFWSVTFYSILIFLQPAAAWGQDSLCCWKEIWS